MEEKLNYPFFYDLSNNDVVQDFIREVDYYGCDIVAVKKMLLEQPSITIGGVFTNKSLLGMWLNKEVGEFGYYKSIARINGALVISLYDSYTDVNIQIELSLIRINPTGDYKETLICK